MAHKMLNSNPLRWSSQEASMYENDFLELVCQNGQIHLQGGPPRRTENGPSRIGYTVNSHGGEACDIDEDSRTTKRARLNTIYPLLDISGQRNSHLDSPQKKFQQSRNAPDTYQFDLQYPKSNKNSIKHLPDTHLMLEDQSANLGPKKESKITRGGHQLAAISDNSEICTSFLQQCLDSARLVKAPATTAGPMTIPSKANNFSNFSTPAVTFKSTHHQGSNATQPTCSPALARLEKMKAGKDNKEPAAAGRSNDECVVIDSAKVSHSLAGFQEQTDLTVPGANPVPLFADNTHEQLPDEHSEAIGRSNTLIRGSHGKHYNRTLAENRAAKGKPVKDNCNEPMIACSSSVSSLGASNDPTYLSRKHEEESDESTDLSSNDEESEGVIKEAPRAKRSRNSEVHNSPEKKRRDKIDKRILALKELIPNCNKMDKASTLDDAIQYITALKLQLQIMSMGTGLCMPYMMLPAGVHHMPQFPTMGAGMGLRPNTALPCSLPQFPPPLAPASLTGINDSRLQMFGLPNQVSPMSMSHAPFIHMMLGKPSTQPVVAPLTATTSPLTTSMDSAADNPDLNAKVHCAVTQTPKQASS